MTTGEMQGRICLVTGATSGIGRAAAHALAGMGATVLVHGRNPKRAEEVASAIRSGGGTAEILLADLASQGAVRSLAGEVGRRFGRLHVLVNNAGLDLGDQRQVTEDGLEMTFAVNYLAPFLLTNLLLPVLRESAPARVITTGSGGHNVGRLNFDDLQGQQKFSGQRAYDQSKLAMVVFTRALAGRIAGTGVTANCVDPGLVKGTRLGERSAAWVRVLAMLLTPFMVRADRGAQTVVWAATAPELAETTGKYLKGRRIIEPNQRAVDQDLGIRLWAVSERLTGLSGSC